MFGDRSAQTAAALRAEQTASFVRFNDPLGSARDLFSYLDQVDPAPAFCDQEGRPLDPDKATDQQQIEHFAECVAHLERRLIAVRQFCDKMEELLPVRTVMVTEPFQGVDVPLTLSSGGELNTAQRKLVETLAATLVPELRRAWRVYEDAAAICLGPDEGFVKEHVALLQNISKPLLPYLLDAPFTARAIYAPQGPGDYGLVNMMIDDDHMCGNNLFGVITNLTFMNKTVEAHRNRIGVLSDALNQELTAFCSQHQDGLFEVLNFACGPARESAALVGHPFADRCRLSLRDHNRLALEDAVRRIGAERDGQLVKRPIVDARYQNVAIAIRRAERLEEGKGLRTTDDAKRYGMVICAGLEDYLTDVQIRGLSKAFRMQMQPGAVAIFTNVSSDNLEHQERIRTVALGWNLILRNVQHEAALVTGLPGIEPIRHPFKGLYPTDDPYVWREATGLNLFRIFRATAA